MEEIMENIEHEFLQFVAEAIKDIYQYNIIEAQEIVTSSFLPELLKEIPDHVQHYDAEYHTTACHYVCNVFSHNTFHSRLKIAPYTYLERILIN